RWRCHAVVAACALGHDDLGHLEALEDALAEVGDLPVPWEVALFHDAVPGAGGRAPGSVAGRAGFSLEPQALVDAVVAYREGQHERTCGTHVGLYRFGEALVI